MHGANHHWKRRTGLAAGAVLVGAISFNALLAIVNGHLKPLTSAPVIWCEAVIVGAALAYALLHFKEKMKVWYLLLVPLVVFAAFRSAATGTLELKFLRDVLIIPTFVVLGMTFPRDRLATLVMSIHGLIVGVFALEAASLKTYSWLFQIKDYYIRTRGIEAEGFWNPDSDLFVSATRPDDRFFAFGELHRFSSIFLEPVSLGNYCIILAAYIFATYRELGLWQRLFLIGGTAVLLVGCDGRLAAIAIVFIAVASLAATRLPIYSTLLVPGAVLLLAVVLVSVLGLHGGADNFAGRMAHTIDLLRRFDVSEMLGISNHYMSQAVDSGIAYLILTQSIFGATVLWCFVIAFLNETPREALVLKLGMAIYISLSFLVSFSFLSIKTAALLWFLIGATQSRAFSLGNQSEELRACLQR